MKVGRIEQLTGWITHSLSGKDRCTECGLSRLDHKYTQNLASYHLAGRLNAYEHALEIMLTADTPEQMRDMIRTEITTLKKHP